MSSKIKQRNDRRDAQKSCWFHFDLSDNKKAIFLVSAISSRASSTWSAVPQCCAEGLALPDRF
jgi:hypothetical protein